MTKIQPIYLDYAATTPVDERVLAAMIPYFTEQFGNPSSTHAWGQQAEAALEKARDLVARGLGARTDEIIFTSCGTESDNLALRGTAIARMKKDGAKHLLISPVEHHAVSITAHQLAEEFGFELEIIGVDEFGRVDPDEIEASIRPDTALVSVIYANNEIGTVNPIAEIGTICEKKGVPLHTDAVQAAAYLPMNVENDQVSLLSIGAHKFYGPKGIGALYIRRGTSITPFQTGGSQEFKLRAGTQNIPYIIGLAEALKFAVEERKLRTQKLVPIRDRLIEGVLAKVPRAKLTGHPQLRLPNHASFVFEGVDGNALLMLLDLAGFACSSGSACRVGNPKPSEVLLAVGFSRTWALGSLRVTLGRDTKPEHIEEFIEVLPGLVEQSRKLVSGS